MKRKSNMIIAITLCLCLMSVLFSGISVSADSGFDTNMTGWTAADGTTWTNDETGYWNGKYDEDSSTGNFKHLAKSDTVISRDKSFTYEIQYQFDGYGVGLALNVVDRNNFYAIEINCEKNVYTPKVENGNWALYGPMEVVATDDQISSETVHTMLFDYDASTGSAKVFVDGTETITLVYVPDSAFGNLGLYYENGDARFIKATYTEKGSEEGPATPTTSFETNMGEWSSADGSEWKETVDGYSCVSSSSGRRVAMSSIEVDGTKSFEYELTFKYSGHGAGMAFAVVDAANVAAIEINRESRLYFPILTDGIWSTFYSDGQNLSSAQMEAEYHTLKFIYYAQDEAAEVYLDDELMQEIWFDDSSVISGKLGVHHEDATVYYTKAIYTEIEDPTPAPTQVPTATPEATEVPATEVPATDAPTEAPAKKDGGCGSSSAVAQVMLILGAALIIKKKK